MSHLASRLIGEGGLGVLSVCKCLALALGRRCPCLACCRRLWPLLLLLLQLRPQLHHLHGQPAARKPTFASPAVSAELLSRPAARLRQIHPLSPSNEPPPHRPGEHNSCLLPPSSSLSCARIRVASHSIGGSQTSRRDPDLAAGLWPQLPSGPLASRFSLRFACRRRR